FFLFFFQALEKITANFSNVWKKSWVSFPILGTCRRGLRVHYEKPGGTARLEARSSAGGWRVTVAGSVAGEGAEEDCRPGLPSADGAGCHPVHLVRPGATEDVRR
ncbi:MAG: hypothetical protein NTY53_27435, partial [Kiritimatiellaeota bacterium]|nr:hypothetical protein [Kiritimatiellota bacterium]